MSDIYKAWQQAFANIPRLSRYTLGTKIDILFCDVLELILLASYTSRDKKLVIIQQASAKFDSLKFFLKLAWEMKLLDHKQYQLIATPLIGVGKMLGSWMQSLQTKTTGAPVVF